MLSLCSRHPLAHDPAAAQDYSWQTTFQAFGAAGVLYGVLVAVPVAAAVAVQLGALRPRLASKGHD
jgi:hypothetical protein